MANTPKIVATQVKRAEEYVRKPIRSYSYEIQERIILRKEKARRFVIEIKPLVPLLPSRFHLLTSLEHFERIALKENTTIEDEGEFFKLMIVETFSEPAKYYLYLEKF